MTVFYGISCFREEKGKIAIIDVQGELITGEKSIFGTTTGELQRALEKAERNEKVKGVVLKVDSPGGSATASYEMYLMLKRFEKPVVAFARGTMASGSYLASLGGNKVLGHPFSTVGSIGVYFHLRKPVSVEPENAVEITVISSGKFKTLWEDDVLDENERKFLKIKADQVEKTFFNIVYEQAPIERPENIEENIENPFYVLTEGGWFDGEKGFEMGLFDELGDLEDSIRLACELAGVKREEVEASEIDPPKPGTYGDMFYEMPLYRENGRPIIYLK